MPQRSRVSGSLVALALLGGVVSYKSNCNSMNEKSIIYGTSLQKTRQFFPTVGAMGRLITAVDATGFNGNFFCSVATSLVTDRGPQRRLTPQNVRRTYYQSARNFQ